MKINFTLAGTQLTAGFLVLYNIMDGLSQRGHQVSVTLHGGDSNIMTQRNKKIEVFKNNQLKCLVSCLSVRALEVFYKKLFKEEMHLGLYRSMDILENLIPECDINVATYHTTAFPVFRSGKGIPFYYCQQYETLLDEDRHSKALAEETYYLPLNKIANSLWVQRQILENFGEEIPIITPAIDLNIFKPRKAKNKNKKLVVSYGRIWEKKGFRYVLEAMKLIFKKRDDIEWIVFGLSPLPLKCQSPEAPYKFIQGIFNEELADLYSSAHIVVNPSLLESFPLPPLEAMACGTAIITTRIGTEDYCFHEKNSLIVPPKDPQAIAEAILRLLEDGALWENLVQNGLETAKQFTWEKTVDKFENLFKKALTTMGKLEA